MGEVNFHVSKSRDFLTPSPGLFPTPHSGPHLHKLRFKYFNSHRWQAATLTNLTEISAERMTPVLELGQAQRIICFFEHELFSLRGIKI